MIRHVDFDKIKALIIASPGYVKDDFKEFLLAKAQETGIRAIRDAKARIITAHSSSGHKRAIREVLQSTVRCAGGAGQPVVALGADL